MKIQFTPKKKSLQDQRVPFVCEYNRISTARTHRSWKSTVDRAVAYSLNVVIPNKINIDEWSDHFYDVTVRRVYSRLLILRHILNNGNIDIQRNVRIYICIYIIICKFCGCSLRIRKPLTAGTFSDVPRAQGHVCTDEGWPLAFVSKCRFVHVSNILFPKLWHLSL